jgi:hypothetical protein
VAVIVAEPGATPGALKVACIVFARTVTLGGADTAAILELESITGVSRAADAARVMVIGAESEAAIVLVGGFRVIPADEVLLEPPPPPPHADNKASKVNVRMPRQKGMWADVACVVLLMTVIPLKSFRPFGTHCFRQPGIYL